MFFLNICFGGYRKTSVKLKLPLWAALLYKKDQESLSVGVLAYLCEHNHLGMTAFVNTWADHQQTE